MPVVHIIVLALVQGLTEFLPVSSSAHLIVIPLVLGWPDQGLVFDVATHLGTLLAVLVYFQRDLHRMLQACLAPVRDEDGRQHRLLVLYLAVASVPAILAGGLLHEYVEYYLRDVRILAATTICFGLVLWWADSKGAKSRQMPDLNLRRATLIGLAQVLSLVPGVSRSGITITAGRFLGFSPDAAARFSFLLAIPIIGAAGAFGAWQVATGDAQIEWSQFFMAVSLSALAGWACIAAFLGILQRIGLRPFIYYRLALGLALLVVISRFPGATT
ncbi:MAG: undecaprenyl-diphosphate phosphatase [Lysobacterales bacterium]